MMGKNVRPPKAGLTLRDRVKELKRIPASAIENAPWNFRTHPEGQVNALRGSLEELGFFKPLDVWEPEPGRYMLIDGQARRDLIGKEVDPAWLVPISVTDLSEAEAKLALAISDPIAAMAETDKKQLDSLLREIETNDEALSQMVTDMAEAAGIISLDEDDEAIELQQIETKAPPVMTWVLVGIPTVRFGEISEQVEQLALIEEIILETVSNDG